MTNLNALTYLPPIASSPLQRFVPEPKSSLSFRGLLSTAKNMLSGGVGAATGINSEYSSLLDRQIELQEQMMLVSLVSNVIKTEHETRMSAVRNMRVA